MSYSDIIQRIENLEHFRQVKCPACKEKQRFYILDIHGSCSTCGTKLKLRGLGSIGTEIEDVIDAVLEWMGEGKTLEVSLNRQRQIIEEVKRQIELERLEENENKD